MPIRIVRLGSPRTAREGLRLGTVRRPPRGATTDAAWRRFAKRYRAEMAKPEASHAIGLLAALSHKASFSVGCYCQDESRCHRSLLRALFVERGADVA